MRAQLDPFVFPDNATCREILQTIKNVTPYHQIDYRRPKDLIGGLFETQRQRASQLEVELPEIGKWVRSCQKVITDYRNGDRQNAQYLDIKKHFEYYRIPKPLRVYRGMSWKEEDHAAYRELKQLDAFGEWRNDSLTTTSLNPMEALYFTTSGTYAYGFCRPTSRYTYMAIDLPEGFPCAPIFGQEGTERNGAGTSEAEVILPPEMNFRVKESLLDCYTCESDGVLYQHEALVLILEGCLPTL